MVDLLGFDDIKVSQPPVEEDNDYFSKSFWGEKYQGFSVLNNNLKHSQASIKALQEFIRERATTEDTYAKHLTKLAKSATPTHATNLGSFSPMFDILRAMSEKLSSCHMDTVHKLNEIIRELGKYQEEYKGKIKQMKERTHATHEALQHTQSTSANVLKSKEKYHHQCLLIERLKAEESNTKDLERLESKSKKAADDYRAHVEKHRKSRIDYETKMTQSCKKFQEVEEFHLERMKKFLDSYVQSFENASILVGQVHREIQTKVNGNTVRALVKQYCEAKGTGGERPAPLNFEECDPGSLLISLESTAAPDGHNGSSEDHQNNSSSTTQQAAVKPSRLPIGRKLPFIRIKGNKKENKKRSSSTGKDADKDSVSAGSPEKDGNSVNVDEEGYTIRPETPKEAGGGNNWKYVSSDESSNSDSDDDPIHKKIHIKIRPKEETPTDQSNNLEALNKITQKLTLNAPNTMSTKKSPTSGAARSMPSVKSSTADSSNQLLDLFNPKQNTPTSTSSSSSVIPRPPSSASNISSVTTGGAAANSEIDLFANAPSNTTATTPSSQEVGNFYDFNRAGMKSAPPTTENQLPSATGDSQRERSRHDKPKTLSNASLNNFFVMPDRLSERNTVGGNSSDEANMTWPTRKGNNTTSTVSSSTTNINSTTSANERKPVGAPLATSESWSSISSSGATTPSFDIGGFNSVSRGPSPLTLSHSDSIPIAVAFTETIDAFITQPASNQSENQYLAKVTGELQMSFPAGIVRTFTSNPNPPTLSFKIKGLPSGLKLTPNPSLLLMDSSHNEAGASSFWFNMIELTSRIKKMTDANPAALFYNISIINYQMGPVQNRDLLPLHFLCNWKSVVNDADIDVNYNYNQNSSCSCPLKNLQFILPVQTNVVSVQTSPIPANWREKEKRLVWTIPNSLLPTASDCSINGKVSLDKSLSGDLKMAAVFGAEGSSSTLTGADFELVGSGYRLSLIKRRFKSGKYFSNVPKTVGEEKTEML